MRRGPEGERGGSAVEFALVLPVLMLILFAILEYGWYMTHQLTLANAVAAGARAGVKVRDWDPENPGDPEEEARRVVREGFWLFDLPEGNIQTDAEVRLGPSGARMLEVKVVDLSFRSLTGYLPDSLLPRRLSAKSLSAFP
ncbi:MAG: pilus assembly protein [Deltaproteobacteria bacterium]|nr:pilus assembly protein [Deltaproteobacteria bacterium]